MGWWFSGFSMIFAICTLISMGIEGSAGFASTTLTAPITATATTINVASTDGFLDSDFIFIDNEILSYPIGGIVSPTQIQNITRGVDNTTKTAHALNTKVYNDSASVLNEMIGYNLATVNSEVGDFRALLNTAWAYAQAVPRLILWDYSFLEGQMALVKFIFLYPISAGFVITLVMAFLQLAQTIFRR